MPLINAHDELSGEIIKIYYECEVGIEKSVPRIMFGSTRFAG